MAYESLLNHVMQVLNATFLEILKRWKDFRTIESKEKGCSDDVGGEG